MTLPRFFSRVADALTPVAGLDRAALAAHLQTIIVHIHAPGDAERSRATLLGVNLAARLYPNLVLHGEPDWLAEAQALARVIHPGAHLTALTDEDADDGPAREQDGEHRHGVRGNASAKGHRHVHLMWDNPGADNVVGIGATGWTVAIDPAPVTSSDGDSCSRGDGEVDRPAHPLANAAAVALGMGEVFRAAFADALADRARTGPQPGSINLITGGTTADATDEVSADPGDESQPELPPVTLVGAGAVGQACLWALIHANVSATVSVVDPEDVMLSNLQRYVLTDDTSVGHAKVDLAQAAACGSKLTVNPVPTPWGADARTGPGVGPVLTALDTAADRIAVAAALPAAAYNAWTQPADIGWSRHEQFGVEPCLACLYYPDRERPNEHELIAAALDQHPLRVLSYLVTHAPVGAPLPLVATVPDLPAPPEAGSWLGQPLLADLVAAGRVSAEEAARWANMPIGQLYRDGVCAGGMMRIPGSDQPEDALVPLAHQSALAGIMLAVTYYAANTPALRACRSDAVEARLDVLRGLPQVVNRPRQRTPGCLCSDRAYLAVAPSAGTTVHSAQVRSPAH